MGHAPYRTLRLSRELLCCGEPAIRILKSVKGVGDGLTGFEKRRPEQAAVAFAVRAEGSPWLRCRL